MLTIDPWIHLVGQDEVRVRLEMAATSAVHAFLFLGLPGTGTLNAALGFAGLILTENLRTDTAAEPDTANRVMHLAQDGKHPDVVVIESEGAALRVAEAEQISRASLRTPVECERKVVIVVDADTIEPTAIGKLLKVIEEPPPSTVFVLLGQSVAPEFVTIASRCVTVEFSPLSADELTAALTAERPDTDPEQIALVAVAANGDLDRARLLLADDALHQRAQLWATAPGKLDGTGSAVAELVTEISSAIKEATKVVSAKNEAELAQLAEWVEQFGERGSGRAAMVARHKRTLRRVQTDEIRFGLSILARHYRDQLADGVDAVATLEAIQQAAKNLVRNPNETLLLQRLFIVCDQ